MRGILLLSGTSNPKLAASVATILGQSLGACQSDRFPDGEQSVCISESVRGRSVFILQSTSPPVTENLFELFQLIDACRRAAAARITAVVPYFGYARADKRHARREPITASMIATLLESVGLDHLVTVDLHAAQIEGFFHLPVDHVTAVQIMCEQLGHKLPPGTVIVSPDEGRVKMASQFASLLGLEVAVLRKQRKSGTETKVMNVVGDVHDRPCLIIDDMISTGGTIAKAVAALLQAGARTEIRVAATHGVMSDGARQSLSHMAIREVYVTDSVTPPPEPWPSLHIVSLAPLLASVIHAIAAEEPVEKTLSAAPAALEQRRKRIEHEKFFS